MRAHLILRALFLATMFGTAVAAQDGGAQPTSDDLRALRYYIQQNETAAIDAEIRRLRIDFPDWTPPEDLSGLLVIGPTAEVDQIYARIAANDLQGARDLIARTQTSFPDWTPPADMMALLELAEAQRDFTAAVEAGRLEAAVSVAVANPALLRCDRINNTWQLAELQAGSGNGAAALAAYRQIVQTCSTVPDVLATIEKADVVASTVELSALVATARGRFPGSAATFDTLEDRLLAGRGIGTEATTAPATSPATAVATAPASSTAPAAPPAAPATVATPAPSAAPSPAPLAAPVPAAPAAVAAASSYDGLPRSGDPRLTRVRNAALAENFAQCTGESIQPRSLDVAYERAWCVYNLDRPLEALALFTAASNGGLGGTVPRDARYGMALSMLALEMTDAASRIAASTDFTSDQRMTIETIILDQRGVRAYEQGDFRQAIIYFDGLEALTGPLRRDLALLRGYAWLNAGNPQRAMAEFQRLNDELATPDTRAAIQAVRDNL